MLIEWLWELKESIDRHGLRWGVAITLFALFRKEKRNYHLDKRDDAIFHNQRILMEHLGLADQFHGQVTLSEADRQSFKRLYLLSQGAIQWGSQLRRGKRMNGQINWITLIPAVFGAIKLILQPFGIDLTEVTDQHVNDIANGIAALATIIGIFATHRKGDSNGAGSVAKYSGDGPAV